MGWKDKIYGKFQTGPDKTDARPRPRPILSQADLFSPQRKLWMTVTPPRKVLNTDF